MFLRGALKNKNKELSNKFSKLSATCKEARICYNVVHIPRDISKIMDFQKAYKTDKLSTFTKYANLFNQGGSYSSLFMFIFQEIHLANLRGLTLKNEAKLYNRYYSYCWCGLILFNLLGKKWALDHFKATSDKEKDAKKKRFDKLAMISSAFDLFPAIGGTGLIPFNDLTKGIGGTAAAVIAIYNNKVNKA